MNSEISTDVEDNSEESIDNSEQIKNLPLKTFLILLERKLKKYFPLQNSDGEETVESKFIRITCTSCRHLLESTDVYNQDKPINIAFAEEDVSKAHRIRKDTQISDPESPRSPWYLFPFFLDLKLLHLLL